MFCQTWGQNDLLISLNSVFSGSVLTISGYMSSGGWVRLVIPNDATAEAKGVIITATADVVV